MFVSILYKLPAVITAVILITGLFCIYIRTRNMPKSEITGILKNTKYFSLRVLSAAALLTLLFGITSYLKSKESTYAVITLNYSEASQAQNSNGTRYNMSEIISDEVIKRAIKKGAFPNVSVSDLKKCLFVTPSVQGGVGNESDYHISTEFTVSYHASRKTRHLDSENVIKLIASSYKEYYIEKYTDNFKIDTAEEKPDFKNAEYMDTVLYFDKEASAILNYLYMMAEKSPGFVTKSNKTFNSIAGEVYQFKEKQIDGNLKSLILQNGIVRDKTGYIDRLSYQNTNTEFDRRKNEASFKLCNSAIAMYSEEMTRVVLVPTWDGSGKYYMGRTKVGIDELSVKATEFSNLVASNEKEIMDNNLIIEKMRASTDREDIKSRADALIASVSESIKRFSDEAVAAGREYSNYKMNQCIALNILGNSIFGVLKNVIIFAVFSYIAVLAFAVSKAFAKKE